MYDVQYYHQQQREDHAQADGDALDVLAVQYVYV